MGNTGQDNSVRVPVVDQHLALCLLLELAIQRGNLCRILEIVILLLEIWQSKMEQRPNNQDTSSTFSAPLVCFLRRFESIGLSKSRSEKELDDIFMHYPENV